jgi:hypothetical protein
MSGKYPWTTIVTTEMVLLCAMNGSHSWDFMGISLVIRVCCFMLFLVKIVKFCD